MATTSSKKNIDTNKAFATVKKANGVILKSHLVQPGKLNPTVNRISNLAQKTDKQIFSEVHQSALAEGKSPSEALKLGRQALSSAKARLSKVTDKNIFDSARSEAKDLGATSEGAFKAGRIALSNLQAWL